MEFKNKMKMRIVTMSVYAIIGVVLCVIGCAGLVENNYVISWGTALTLCGIVKIIQLALIMRNPEKMEKRAIAEKDERNIMIYEKSRSLAFTIYIMAAGIAVIALFLLNLEFAGRVVAYTVCGFLVIYLICCAIIRRKY